MKAIEVTNETFRSANECAKIMGRRAGRLAIAQPGYRRGQTMKFETAAGHGGGVRLYAAIGGRWMDASLSNLVASITRK